MPKPENCSWYSGKISQISSVEVVVGVVMMKSIDTYFKNDLLAKSLPGTATVHFKSGHTWRDMMRELVDLPKWHQGTVDYYLHQGWLFHFREIRSTIK